MKLLSILFVTLALAVLAMAIEDAPLTQEANAAKAVSAAEFKKLSKAEKSAIIKAKAAALKAAGKAKGKGKGKGKGKFPPPTAADYLVIDKSLLKIAVGDAQGKLTIRLRAKPTARTLVYPSAKGIRFNKCAVEFTPANFDTPQELTVVAEPGAPVKGKIQFVSYSDACDDAHHNKRQDVPTECDEPAKGTSQCTVTGDPHYKTLDGKVLHFQGKGTFWVFKSKTLAIQAKQGQWQKTPATVVTHVAVRYGQALAVIDSTAHSLEASVRVVTHTEGLVISKTQTGGVRSINVAFRDGSVAKFDIMTGKNAYINSYFTPASHLKGKNNGGLCGAYDDDAATTFRAPGGGKVFNTAQILATSNSDEFNQKPTFKGTELFKFGEACRVTSQHSIFELGSKCADHNEYTPEVKVDVTACTHPDPSKAKCPKKQPPPITTTTATGTETPTATVPVPVPTGGCPKPVPVPPVPPGYRPAPGPAPKYTPGKDDQSPINPGPVAPPPPKEVVDKCKTQCAKRIRPVDGCKVDAQEYVRMCEMDIVAQMHPDAAVLAANLGYMEACTRELLCKLKGAEGEEAKKIEVVVKKHCLGTASCDANCAQCGERGCLQCKDATYEPQGGVCVAKPAVEPVPTQYFSSPPEQRPVAKADVVPMPPPTPNQDYSAPAPPPDAYPSTGAQEPAGPSTGGQEPAGTSPSPSTGGQYDGNNDVSYGGSPAAPQSTPPAGDAQPAGTPDSYGSAAPAAPAAPAAQSADMYGTAGSSAGGQTQQLSTGNPNNAPAAASKLAGLVGALVVVAVTMLL